MLHTRPAQLAAPMLAVLPLQASAPHYILLVCLRHPKRLAQYMPHAVQSAAAQWCRHVCRALHTLCTLAEMPIVWSDGLVQVTPLAGESRFASAAAKVC